MQPDDFQPCADSVTIAATTTAAKAALPGSPTAGTRLLIVSSAATLAYIRYGIDSVSPVVATLNDTPVNLGTVRTIINLGGKNVDTVSVILASGTASIVFQRGQ